MEKVHAMPSLCDSTDFGLSNEDFNKSKGLGLLPGAKHIAHVDEYDLYRSGGRNEGQFFLWDPVQELIVYYMKYKTQAKRFTGRTVTQVNLWRSLGDVSPGFTQHMVFGVLLKEYPAILSDSLQTENGKKFWIDLLGRAMRTGHQVGLVDFGSGQVSSITSKAQLRLLEQGDTAWAWNSPRHSALRFIIYRKD